MPVWTVPSSFASKTSTAAYPAALALAALTVGEHPPSSTRATAPRLGAFPNRPETHPDELGRFGLGGTVVSPATPTRPVTSPSPDPT